MTAEPVTLSVLLAGAVGVGVLHTLLGPDHWLPWIGLARERGWSGRRAVGVTALAGVLHCATSALLVPVAALLVGGAAALAGLQELRGNVAAMALVGLGVALLLAAWRRSRADAPSRPGGHAASAVLLLVFALGPCEWLIPGALAATAAHGAWGGALVALAFTAATVATMLAAVAFGLRLLPSGLRLHGALPGVACALSGALMLLGL